MKTYKIICLLAMVFGLYSCDGQDYDETDNIFGRMLWVEFEPIEGLRDDILMAQSVDSLTNDYFVHLKLAQDERVIWAPETERGETVPVFMAFCDSIAKDILPLFMADLEEGIRSDAIHYIYAGIEKGARIYADRELFGCPAGTNLGAYFEYSSYRGRPYYQGKLYPTVAQIRYPDGKPLAVYRDLETPYTFNDIFQEGAMPGQNFYMRLNVPTDERMEGAILSVEIPLEGELLKKAAFGHDYLYRREDVKSHYDRHRMLKGSIQIQLPKR